MECLGFEPGPQDGGRRRDHAATAATQVVLLVTLVKMYWFFWSEINLSTFNYSFFCFLATMMHKLIEFFPFTAETT